MEEKERINLSGIGNSYRKIKFEHSLKKAIIAGTGVLAFCLGIKFLILWAVGLWIFKILK